MSLFRINDGAELRLLEAEHAAELYAMTSRHWEYFRQWMPNFRETYSLTESTDFIRQRMERFAAGQELSTGIWESNQLVGVVALKGIDRVNRSASIGYYLAATHQGRGLITQSCRILLDYAFTELLLNRVDILCAHANYKSRRIPERLGFREEGTLREAQWLYDHYVDLVVYAMLKQEWESRDE